MVVLGAVVAVVAALIVVVALAVRDDGESSDVPAGPSAETSAPGGRPATLPTTVAPSTVPSEPPPTTSPSRSTVAPAASTTPATAPSSAPGPTTAPGSVPATATTVPASPAPGAFVVASDDVTPEAAAALENARVLATALAAGDWAAARQLGPTDRRRTDAQLETAYGPVTDVTLMPARVVRSGQWIDLRLGLVAHEDHESGPATAVMCVHWRVDETTRAVERISSVRLRLEQGTLDPSVLVDELTARCATYPLR